nr:reverse transcriptase domain-containing protein [Tanacetum cinerariifolium]
MLVDVGKFTFPANFVILEMDEDNKVLLILGRPFLHTTDAVIRSNDDTCFSINVVDEILEEDFDALLDEGSKILHSIERTLLEEEIFSEFDEFMAMTADENSKSESDTKEPPFEKISINTNYKINTSLEEASTDLELKPLPDNLLYVFLEEPSFLPVIISSKVSTQNKSYKTHMKNTINLKFLQVLNHDKFQMSSMGERTFFLGLQVKQKEDGIFISHDKYVAEILKKFDFMSVKTASTPIKTRKPLTKDEEVAD